jgi:transglutaminase-like putative cysteine protease
MAVRVSVSVLALVLSADPAFSQSEQVRRGPAPAWVTPSELLPVPENVGGPVFMRRQDVLIRLDDQGQAQYLGYRVKILHSNALELGNISIAWNPAAGAPTVHEIKVHRGGEIVDVLAKSSFEILRREDQLEAARLDGTLTAVLRIPDLRVGDELEFGLTTIARDPTLGDNDSGLLMLPPNPAPGRYRFGLSWGERRNTSLKMTADMAAAAIKGDRAVTFRFDNPASVTPPKDAPPRFQWQRVVEFSNFTDWATVSRHFAPLFVKAATVAGDSPIKREAGRIASANVRPLDRASAALRMVQQDVRYIYVGLNGGNLNPASADETWQRRYGDCKGKTALLLALLAELGIKAEAVLVNTSGNDDGFDQRLPLPQLFDHVLVRAYVDGATYWLDGTLPPVAPPSLKPIYPVRWVLPLAPRGGSIENLGWRPAATPDDINLFEIDARTGFDKPARITSTSIVRGIKGLQQQVQFSAMSPAQLLNNFRQEAVGDTWQAIDEVRWRYDQKAAASILTIVGTGMVNWDDDGDGARSMALPGGGFSPPEKRVRSADQNQDVPFYIKPEYDCRVTTVRLPSSTQAKHWSSKPGYDTRMFGRNYYRALELREGSIRMIRASRVEQQEIDAVAARRDNGRIAAFDNSMAYVFYNPSAQKASVGSGGSVPATYELDWTASDVPCVLSAKPG